MSVKLINKKLSTTFCYWNRIYLLYSAEYHISNTNYAYDVIELYKDAYTTFI